MTMYSRILVPLDGSKLAEQILPYARLLAAKLGSRLEVLGIVPEDAGDTAAQICIAQEYLQGVAKNLEYCIRRRAGSCLSLGL